MLTLIIIILSFFTANSQGFNLGQQHYRQHQLYRNNGYIPADTVQKWKGQVPLAYRSFSRKSGTMSNSWNLDSVGYNHLQHTIQLNNQRIPQPTVSYIHPYLQFLRDWKYDSIVWTINSHLPYLLLQQGNKKASDYYVEQLFQVLDSVAAITKVSHICLDNETYLDPRIIGISAGTPTAADKIKYKGTGGLFTPNARFESDVKSEYQKYLDFLKPIVARLRAKYPNAKLAISCDHPITLRGRWNLDVLKQNRSLYDIIDVHLYPAKVSNRSQTAKWVNDRLNGFAGMPIVVFEWNYHYDSGQPYNGFHKDMESILKPYLNLRHTLWYQGSGFTFLP